MGWSCSAEASRTLEKMKEYAESNGFDGSNMVSPNAFFEMDGIEHDDGRVTGRVHSMVSGDLGKGEISADGKIIDMPGLNMKTWNSFISAAPNKHGMGKMR